MKRVKIKRPRRHNAGCAHHLGGHCMNPAHSHFQGYGAHTDPNIDVTHDELVEMGYETPEDVTANYDYLVDLFPMPKNTSATEVATGNKATNGAKYARSGQRLPFIKGGATDASAEKKSGIKGLITQIQNKMLELSQIEVMVDGKITDKQIRDFQTEKKLDVDGVIGKQTYVALGFKAPYPQSSSGGSTYNPTTDKDSAVGGESIVDKVWFYPAVGVGGLGLLIVILKMLKKKKKKKQPQMLMNRY